MDHVLATTAADDPQLVDDLPAPDGTDLRALLDIDRLEKYLVRLNEH